MGLLSGFLFFISTQAYAYQVLSTESCHFCPPYCIFNARLRNTRLSTRKREFISKLNFKKICTNKATT